MDSILYWNSVALEANRVSHTAANGEQQGPCLSSRALAIVHLAMHDAFFAIDGGHALYWPIPPGGPTPGTDTASAVAGAAYTTLLRLYTNQRGLFDSALNAPEINEGDPSFTYGVAVGAHLFDMLAIKPGDPGVGSAGYVPSPARGRHRVDPDNPGQGFYGPFYGATARHIAAQSNHTLNPPPALNSAAYLAALDEVIAQGGAPDHAATMRKPKDTLIGLFWAYDGASQIGTPPRLYNRIVQVIAKKNPAGVENTPAQNARLFALVNAAMGDAGIFAWYEKYDRAGNKDLWRPVLGVREHDNSMGPKDKPGAHNIDIPCDPFWLPLGAPKTNEAKKSFTPNFPAYPSGHATFGAAAFQMVRRFYSWTGQTPDNIAFEFVSDELDGKSTDSNGTVRTRHKRKFDSLWEAIFENGLSRVFLGVHWHFDAFDAKDVHDKDGYKDPKDITYNLAAPIGGVPLGLSIADDIYDNGLKAAPDPLPAVASASTGAKSRRGK